MAKETAPEINRALREIVGELHVTVDDIVRRTGYAQASVYRWIHSDGGRGPSLSIIPKIEEALGLPKGEILRRAGYVEMPMNIIDLLQVDPALDMAYRPIVVETYQKAVEASRANRFLLHNPDPTEIAREAKGGFNNPDAS